MTPAEEWKRCRDWIISALPYCDGTHTIEDIEDGIARGEMIFIPGRHSALVLQLAVYPQMKELIVFLGGGERGWKTVNEYRQHLDAEVVKLARFLCCDRVKHFCRDGGTRIGEALGYRKQSVVMVKDV